MGRFRGGDRVRRGRQDTGEPGGPARAHFGRYQLLRAKTDREGCVACLTEAIRLDPKNPLYPLYRGARLGELGKNELALEDANKALEIAGKDLDPSDWIEFAPYVYMAFHNRACGTPR